MTAFTRRKISISPWTRNAPRAKVQVGPHRLTAKAFMSSTGSVVSHVPIAGLEEVGYLTGDEASERRDSPQSMIVLGGGPVALKLAEFFHPIGTAVTLIQRSTHVTSQGDEDLARPVKARFREEGMTVSTHARLYRLTKDGTHNSGFSGEWQNFGSPYCWAGSCGIDS